VATVVRERRVADQALTRGADRGDAPRGPEPAAQVLLGGRGAQAPEVGGALDARAAAVDEEDRGDVAGAADDDRVVARELARDREVARGEGVVQETG
jgi:hypothetical protein